MIVGTLQVSLLLRGSHSLKDKRRVVRSLKDRISAKFNVSVAEVDSQDLHQRADLGIATVSGSRDHAEQVLHQVLALVDQVAAAERFHTEMEFF